MRPTRDPASAIVAQLAPLIGPASDIVAGESPWASATFVGRQLRIAMTVDRPAMIDHLAEVIGSIEFDLRGCFVADIVVIEAIPLDDQLRLTIESLVIDEA